MTYEDLFTYKDFKKLAKKYYPYGGKFFYDCWDEKMFCWYSGYVEQITPEVAIKLFSSI